MYPDVVTLHRFYDSRLGQITRRHLRLKIRELWPDLHQQSVLGLGYATPYLRPFLNDTPYVFAGMPAGQGVIPWPQDAPNRVFLYDETYLPFPDVSVDRVMLVHSLEHSESLRLMLRQVWRVLAGGGRLLIVVPNRRGIWARIDHTPFGHGRPYTGLQIRELLTQNMFFPLKMECCLFYPPSLSTLNLRLAAPIEKIGKRWLRPLSGVLVIEAMKQIYAAPPSQIAETATPQKQPLIYVPNSAASSSQTDPSHSSLIPHENDFHSDLS